MYLQWPPDDNSITDEAAQFYQTLEDDFSTDIESMKRELKSVDWENILGNLSAEDSWNLFKLKMEKSSGLLRLRVSRPELISLSG